jgi:hypothetical protein
MAHEGPRFPLREKSTRPGPFIAILVATAAILGIIIWLTGWLPRADAPPVVTDAVPQASPGQVQFTDVTLMPSPTLEVAGVAAMYVQGLVVNTGQMPLNTIITEVVLRDEEGDVVQHETQPVVALTEDEPTPQEVALEQEPLQPQQSRPFRIAVQRVPPQWNRQMPEIHVVSVTSPLDHGRPVEVTPGTAGETVPGPAMPDPLRPPAMAQPEQPGKIQPRTEAEEHPEAQRPPEEQPERSQPPR